MGRARYFHYNNKPLFTISTTHHHFRPAYADELSRARALGQGATVPPSARYLLAMIEQPVERIIAAFPYWPQPPSTETDKEESTYEFAVFFGSFAGDPLQLLDGAIPALESAAREAGAKHLRSQSSYPDTHPIFQKLTSLGYEIARTDHHFTVPGEIAKERAQQAIDPTELPPNWHVESIRGQDPQEIYQLLAKDQLMTPQQFQQSWDSSNKEHFEEAYSCVLLDQQTLIGILLISKRGDSELHIQAQATHTADATDTKTTKLILPTLRHHALSQCPAGFPQNLTWHTDSNHLLPPTNTSFHHESDKKTSLHYLAKTLHQET